MAANINLCIIAGNLTADPEIKNTAGGTAVGRLRVAVNKQFMKDGEKKKTTEYIPVTVWGVTAENCAKFLAKGSNIMVEGRFSTRSWDGTDGKKHYASEIIAEKVTFLNSKRAETDTKSDEPGFAPEQGEEVPY